MKIVLEHGNQFYIQICKYCNCKFLYQGIDASWTKNKDHDTYEYTVQCPECNSILTPSKEKYNQNDSLNL